MYIIGMAHLHKKIKKGRPYYYFREIARVNGKPKVVRQIYLGTPERILKLITSSKREPIRFDAQEFGALWLANLIDRKIDLVSLIDSVVPRKDNEKDPSVGEYFLYAVFNRMIDPCSKKALCDWYKNTAIQSIRPVNIKALTSQRFWDKWSRVEEKHLEKIISLFFEKVAQVEEINSECFLFDTTNYYSYMASHTESELAKRGKNKDGKSWLRQVGVALLVSRENQIPLFYRTYEGNRHDSALFNRLLEEVFSVMDSFGKKSHELTLVIDKGMNSEENIKAIDAHSRLHFITTYSPYFAEHLIRVDLSCFKPVDTMKNRILKQGGKDDDLLLAWRTVKPLWGHPRAVIITYNPRTAAKQRYNFEAKLSTLQQTLLELRLKVAKRAYWRNEKRVKSYYEKVCEHLHIPKDLYDFAFEKVNGSLRFVFRKNYYRIGRYIERFGKNIIVTDLLNWDTADIVNASLDRYIIENLFRQSKDHNLVSVMPFRHWTDGKIRCHIFTCIVALTYLRLIQRHLQKEGLKLSSSTVICEMQKLHACLYWLKGDKKPKRLIEDPTPLQGQIIKAFGYQVVSGVLQKV